MSIIIDPTEYKFVHQLSCHNTKYYTHATASEELIIEEYEDNTYRYYDGNWRYLGESPDSVFESSEAKELDINH